MLVINLSEEPQDVNVVYAEVGIQIGSGIPIAALDVWSGAAIQTGIGKKAATFKSIGAHDCIFLVLSVGSNADVLV